MIELTNLAYTAGYIDGDGCFHLGKEVRKGKVKYSAKLIISSVNPCILNWLKSIFVGSVRKVKRRKMPKGHKDQYHFIFENKSFKKIPNILINQLLVEKRFEGALFMSFLHSRSKEDKELCIDELIEEKNHAQLVKNTDKEEFESIRNTIEPTEFDFCYLAGFIDAECCLGIQRYVPKGKPNRVYKILLQCNNTKRPFFKWALQRFGGQIHFIERKKSMSQRDQLCWRLSAKSLYPILKRIKPHIKYKLPVCEELIKFYETTIPLENIVSRNSSAFAEMYLPILEDRERIFHRVKALNKKGV